MACAFGSGILGVQVLETTSYCQHRAWRCPSPVTGHRVSMIPTTMITIDRSSGTGTSRAVPGRVLHAHLPGTNGSDGVRHCHWVVMPADRGGPCRTIGKAGIHDQTDSGSGRRPVNGAVVVVLFLLATADAADRQAGGSTGWPAPSLRRISAVLVDKWDENGRSAAASLLPAHRYRTVYGQVIARRCTKQR